MNTVSEHVLNSMLCDPRTRHWNALKCAYFWHTLRMSHVFWAWHNLNIFDNLALMDLKGLQHPTAISQWHLHVLTPPGVCNRGIVRSFSSLETTWPKIWSWSICCSWEPDGTLNLGGRSEVSRLSRAPFRMVFGFFLVDFWWKNHLGMVIEWGYFLIPYIEELTINHWKMNIFRIE